MTLSSVKTTKWNRRRSASRKHCILLLLLLTTTLLNSSTARTSRGETGFERAMAYSRAVQELNKEFESTFAQTEKISKTAALLLQNLKTAKNQNDLISTFGSLQKLVVDMQNLSAAIENSERLPSLDKRISASRTAQQRSISRLQLLQINTAKQLTLKRARDIALELQTLMQEYQDLFNKANRFFSSYQELADVYGMRTRLEWQAALHQLEDPPKANLGARYLRAVTLRRIGKFSKAASEFGQLVDTAAPMKPLFQAAQAECLVLAGELREGKRLIGSIQGAAANHPGVQGYRGLIAAMDEDWRTAVSAWKIDLKNGGREVGLRRNIAIGQTILSKKNSREAERALENIQVANDLSGQSEWSVHLAMAIVYLALDDRANAVAAAEESVRQSCHECLFLCEQSVEQLKQGVSPVWDFATH